MANLFLPLFLHFPLFIAHFSMPNSISLSWLCILIVCVRVSSSFSFFANTSNISSIYIYIYIYIRWLIFIFSLFCRFVAPGTLAKYLVQWHHFYYTAVARVSLPGRKLRSFSLARVWPPAINWFGLVSLFNGISTIVGYLMPKPFSYKNSSGNI